MGALMYIYVYTYVYRFNYTKRIIQFALNGEAREVVTFVIWSVNRLNRTVENAGKVCIFMPISYLSRF